MDTIKYEKLLSNLERLKLHKISEILDNYIERVNKENISFTEALYYLINEEREYKEQKSLEIRTQVAGFPYRKTIEDFDFNFQPSIDRKQIDELRTMRFVSNKENVVLLGPPGVGKTHLAIALGIEAIRHNFSVYYTNCHELIQKLNRAHYENNLQRQLKTYLKYKILIIDEVGYLPFDIQGANLFFQLISRKYENSSVILTSNKSFKDWGDIFTDDVIASAILDRLLHHATVINIKGNSYRLKDRINTNIKIRQGCSQM